MTRLKDGLRLVALSSVTALVLLSGCSSWVVESAQTSAQEADALAKCVETNAPTSAAARLARIRANEAKAAAATATGLDNSSDSVVTAAKEEAERKANEADVAAREAAEATADANKAGADYENLKKKVEAYDNYEAARANLTQVTQNMGGLGAAQALVARSKRGDDMSEEEIVNLSLYQSATAGAASTEAQLSLTFPDSRNNPQLVADAREKIRDAEEKAATARSKQQYAERKKNEAALAKAAYELTEQNARKLAATKIDTAAKKANEAADQAAEAAATIPECNKLARSTRPDFFNPFASIRPHNADIFGRQIGGKTSSGTTTPGHAD